MSWPGACLLALLLAVDASAQMKFTSQGNHVAGPDGASFTIAPAESVAIVDEKYVLSDDAPDRWIAGTHLKGCVRANALPGCLIPGSVTVKLADGTAMQRDKDYLVDEKWASLGRIKSGRIPAGAEVHVSYRAGQMRIDTIAASPKGEMALVKGEPAVTCPKPPEVSKGSIPRANIFMPYDGTSVEAWQIYPIGEAFPEPDNAELTRRAALVPKTLAKIRSGGPLTIVAWGDSVTAGGDSSTPEKAFPQLFATSLGQRYPKSRIKLINAGIGATNTIGRLPGLAAEVLAHKPDLVTIEFVNDMGFPAQLVRDNYKKIFTDIRAAGAEIILLTPHFTMPEFMGRDTWRGGECRPTVELLRKIAAEHNVALADASRRWEHLEVEGIPYATLLFNGINHPDDRGHDLFVKELMTFFP